MDQITYIPLSSIVPNKNNLRNAADKNNLEELAESIKSVGIINPITVRLYEDNLAQYEIVSGERRFKAAEIAGLETMPAIIKEIDDNVMMEIIITENLQRKEINPLDEASGFNWLLNTGRYSIEAIADRVGKSSSYITKRLKFIQLTDEVRDLFREDKITIGHALEFARLNEDQQAKMLKWMDNHKYSNPTANSLKEAIQQTFHLKIKDAVFDVEDDLLLEDLPSKNKYCGVLSCKMCPKRTAFNTNLFDDIEDDLCTDPDCFDTKVKAHIKKTVETYIQKGKPIIEYQHTDSEPKNGIFTKKSGLVFMNKDTKKCENAVTAIVSKIGPYYTDLKVGDILKVCKDADCKVHHKAEEDGYKSGGKSIKESDAVINKKLEKIKFERNIVELAEVKAVMAITKKLKYPLDDLIIDDIIETIIDQWDLNRYAREISLVKQDEDFDLGQYLNKKSNLDRLKLLVGYILWADNRLASKLYKKYRVDFTKLKKEARVELKLQKKEQAKAVDKDLTIPENEGYESDKEDED